MFKLIPLQSVRFLNLCSELKVHTNCLIVVNIQYYSREEPCYCFLVQKMKSTYVLTLDCYGFNF